MAKIGMYFPKSEYARRLKNVRRAMDARRLEAILVSCPESIYYLSGLDHMGYFAYQMLVVPLDDDPILITRAMERATVQDQAPGLKHVGYSDAQIPETEVTVIEGHDPEGAAPEEAIGGSDPWMQPQGMPVRSPGSRRVQPYGSAPVRYTIQAIEDAGLSTKRLGLEMSGSFLPYATARDIVAGLDEADWSDCSGLVDDCRLVQSERELTVTRDAAR
jgi:Xaa-Pro dipeptidase